MPDFTSNVTVLPPDQITPAINDLAGNMMKMTQFKAAEQEKRDAKMAELATVSLGDVFEEDNAALQKEKEDYINYIVKEAAPVGGRFGWQKQAEINAKKQRLMQKGAKSVQDKNDYVDVMKKIATDPNIDAQATSDEILKWKKESLETRGSIYSAIQPKTSLQKVFKDNVHENITEGEIVEGGKKYKTKEFRSLPQLMAIVSENTIYQNAVSKEMQKVGIAKPANGYNAEQIGTFLQQTYAPMFDKDPKLNRVMVPPKSSTHSGDTYVIGDITTSSGSTRPIQSKLTADGRQLKSGTNTMNITFGNEASLPQKATMFPSGEYNDCYCNTHVSGYNYHPFG
jgi:hypothetical protein